ncbi:MAG TPA: polymer-forming cytoskeletal protein [Pyrinomonadaceae bacterium]|nr:polymer-forming cytoskeletal protein [Pyrinomonadaceae bacterium]
MTFSIFQPTLTLPDPRLLARAAAILCALLCAGVAVSARTPSVRVAENDPTTLIVEGDDTKDVFGMGRSVIVRGRVRHGVMTFGGDVVIEGRVDGDVGVIGGTITQRENSYVGGDVLVIGGAYHHGKVAPGRDPASKTIMFAGYEEELRELGRNPASLLEPKWTVASFGLRVLSILFWFIISLGLTAASPGAISRAASRLQLTSLRVAVIGLLAAFVLAFGVPVALHVLPPVLGLFVGALSILLLLVAYLFGRVAIHAATGRWLQRLLLREEQRSESIALLIGAAFWAVVLSLPYLWAFAVAALVVTSLGLALTVRYRIGWKSPARA